MSLSCPVTIKVPAVETFTGPFVSTSDPTMTDIGPNLQQTFDGTTTVPVTKKSVNTVVMSGGVGSINLAALPGNTSEETVVGTGLKVQFLIFRNKSTNANSITVAKGASNGYGVNAAGTTWTISISPGQTVWMYLADAAPDVASGARVLDVTGTGAQVLEYEIILG